MQPSYITIILTGVQPAGGLKYMTSMTVDLILLVKIKNVLFFQMALSRH